MASDQAKQALIADDHHLYRSGLSLLLKDQLGFTHVFEAHTFDAAIDCMDKNPGLGLALFDLSMPGMNSGACLAELRAQHPMTKLAIVSASEEKADVMAAIDGGLNGFMPKTLSNDKIVAALRDIMCGRIFIPSLITTALPAGSKTSRSASALRNGSSAAEKSQQKDALTPRQRDVFNLACKGLTNKEIGERLGISEGTVKIHISAMLTILGLRNRAEFLSLR